MNLNQIERILFFRPTRKEIKNCFGLMRIHKGGIPKWLCVI
nr:MAG TPA: hypothetical protein [Caudoviricetes sp.]